jgi:hypothetical protein
MIKIQNINDGQQMIDAKQWQSIERKLKLNIPCGPLQSFFVVEKIKMSTTAGHRWPKDIMGKY